MKSKLSGKAFECLNLEEEDDEIEVENEATNDGNNKANPGLCLAERFLTNRPNEARMMKVVMAGSKGEGGDREGMKEGGGWGARGKIKKT
ncbi:hypothetical protein TSUD_178840 [Trifolium subterraneum]|uniref:Uncharacterized protein n=1 Tax=Trifolium subterraneum TaxID=3900 RepID=A0A2Z6NMF5_TRISU|nr:hypothetical protein TSUD_178840 [Trifolium subterraneum]